LPDPARTLLEAHRLRILGAPLGVSKIDAAPSGIVVQFVPEPPVDPRKVIALVQSSRIYKLPGPDKVRIEMKHEDLKARAGEVRQFLRKLA
jgi:transcription-repair coupling factor (superfamily II helicase)